MVAQTLGKKFLQLGHDVIMNNLGTPYFNIHVSKKTN